MKIRDFLRNAHVEHQNRAHNPVHVTDEDLAELERRYQGVFVRKDPTGTTHHSDWRTPCLQRYIHRRLVCVLWNRIVMSQVARRRLTSTTTRLSGQSTFIIGRKPS